MSFIGGESLDGAFIIANNKNDIVIWFTSFYDFEEPEKYGIVRDSEDHISMTNAVTAIKKFSEFLSPVPFFDDERVPKSKRVTAHNIKYRGRDVVMTTIFDVIGWVLSVVGNRAAPPSRADYYYPLVTLYAVICRALLKQKPRKPPGPDTPQTGMEAGMLQVTWFQENDVWRVVLGANLDNPTGKLKGTTKNDRAQRMLFDEVITDEQYQRVNNKPVQSGEKPQVHFGYCAETLPFTFIQWIGPDKKIKSTIGGIAVVPQILLTSDDGTALVDTRYDQVKGKFDPLSPNTKNSALEPPCRNCTEIVDRIFGGEDALARFQLPIL